jgi:hypothetical protein
LERLYGGTLKHKKMPTIVKLEDIEAWQTSRELAGLVYNLTRRGQFARDFGLCDQMKHASVSIHKC